MNDLEQRRDDGRASAIPRGFTAREKDTLAAELRTVLESRPPASEQPLMLMGWQQAIVHDALSNLFGLGMEPERRAAFWSKPDQRGVVARAFVRTAQRLYFETKAPSLLTQMLVKWVANSDHVEREVEAQIASFLSVIDAEARGLKGLSRCELLEFAGIMRSNRLIDFNALSAEEGAALNRFVWWGRMTAPIRWASWLLRVFRGGRGQ